MRSIRQRLEDILDAIGLIQEHCPADFGRYEADVVVRYFLLKQMEIIGEAAFKLDKEFKERHAQISWRKIEGTRHILVHDYFDVDWTILWDIIHLHISPLQSRIQEVLHEFPEG